MSEELYAPIDKTWKTTCKILLGTEVGSLLEFADYLKRYIDPIEKRKSIISGKEVTISSNKIPQNVPVISQNEVQNYQEKTSKIQLNINKIKDIDSILAELNEKICYTGDISLGNSANILNSHRCVNTHYALECQDVYDGKYVAFTTSIRNPQYSFGCCFGGDIQFCIKVLDPYKQTRCMETFHCNVVSDSYYSASLEDCSDCIFSFNQRNKRYLIGNLQLNKDKYSELKSRLIREITDTFKKNKKLISIIDIIKNRD